MRTPDDIYDELLVLRCQGGDRDAFSMLVERWQPRLLSLAIRLLRDPVEAEDVVQSSWVIGIRKIGSIHDPTSLRPWLFRIVANKCVDVIRRRQMQRRREKRYDESTVTDPISSPTVSSDSADRIDTLRMALREMDCEKRAILRLHYLDGQSIQQIAQSQSLPAGTVKSRLHYARNALRQILKGENRG